MKQLIAALPLMLALGLACGGDSKPASADKKSEKKDEVKAADAKPADAPPADAPPAAEPAAAGPLELSSLGLKIEGPAGTEVKPGLGGKGHMVQGPGLVLTVDLASDFTPKTLEDGKKESEMYTEVTNLKEETLEDGWAVTWENQGGMGTNYVVNVRREIGDKSVWCTTTASQPEQQANALAACKSIKP